MEKLSSEHSVDLTGQKFGKLLVLGKADTQPDRGAYNYKCKCDCGVEVVVNGTALRHNNRTSCKRWECLSDISSVLEEKETPETAVQNAYFAGHFDGEGCISFQRDSTGTFPGLTARVSAVYKPVILEYQDYFGGSVHEVEPPNTHGRSHCRYQWLWHISAVHQVLRFIRRVLPYSHEKRAQLELAHEYIMLRVQSAKHDAGDEVKAMLPELVQKMSELKRFEFPPIATN